MPTIHIIYHRTHYNRHITCLFFIGIVLHLPIYTTISFTPVFPSKKVMCKLYGKVDPLLWFSTTQSYSLFCIISFINHTFSLYVRYIQMMMWKLQKDCWDIDCVLFHLASRTKLDKREEKYRYIPCLPILSKKLFYPIKKLE